MGAFEGIRLVKLEIVLIELVVKFVQRVNSCHKESCDLL